MDTLLARREICITNQIASELIRNTFRLRPEMMEIVQEFLDRDELVWIGDLGDRSKIRHRDSSDQPILDAAISNDVDIIVTGDKGFHALEIDRPRIMTPADFITEFVPETH